MVFEALETRNHVFYMVLEHFGLGNHSPGASGRPPEGPRGPGGRQEAPRRPRRPHIAPKQRIYTYFTGFQGGPGFVRQASGVVNLTRFWPGGMIQEGGYSLLVS